MPVPIRVLITDDHPVVRAGLRGMLSTQPDFQIVGEAADGHVAVERAIQLAADVVLMDLRMPVLDGVEAIRRLQARAPGIRILVLTTYDSDADIVPAIEAGAIGYLLKDAPRDQLFAGIRDAARGRTVRSPRIARRLAERSLKTEWSALSGRELEVLRHVARGASSRDIGRALAISEGTVKSHLVHIYRKLGVSDRTAAVTTALERGIIGLPAREQGP